MTKTRYQGALTVEAAIVLPIVLICFVFLLSIARTIYIQQQIESALLKTAQTMALDAYVLNKGGVVNLQQDLYREGVLERGYASILARERVDTLDGLVGIVSDESVDLLDYGQRVTQYGASLNGLKSSPDFHSFYVEAEKAIDEGQAMAKTAMDQMTGMLAGLEAVSNEVMAHYGATAAGIGVLYANRYMANGGAEVVFKSYMSQGRLESWGIDGLLDFDDCSYLIVDDTVVVDLSYDVNQLFGKYLKIPGIKVNQKVVARAWTGSYDSDEIKKINKESVPQPIYYVSTRSNDVNCYHVYSCLRKPLIAGVYQEAVINQKREVCLYCQRHYAISDETMPIYYTSSSAKVHLNPQCPLVYGLRIRAVTADEAEAEGFYPCSKPGCAADHKAEGQ